MRFCGLQHRQVDKAGDTIDAAFAAGAQGEVGAGIIPRQIVTHNFRHERRREIAVENTRLARFGYLHQGLGVTEADTAYLDDIRLQAVFHQLLAEGFQYVFSAGGQTAGARADIDTGVRAVLQGLPIVSLPVFLSLRSSSFTP